jgi:hypothetical protein
MVSAFGFDDNSFTSDQETSLRVLSGFSPFAYFSTSAQLYSSALGKPPTIEPDLHNFSPITYQDASPPNSYSQTPSRYATQSTFLNRKDSWPSLTDALTGKRTSMLTSMLTTSPAAPVKGDQGNGGGPGGYSPLRGDAEFFTPRPFVYQPPAMRDGTRVQDMGGERQKLMDCGIPMPRNQERQVGNLDPVQQGNGGTFENGNGNGAGGREEAMYHLLPAFSPFDDDVALPETRS